MIKRIDRLAEKHRLTLTEYETLIRAQTPELMAYAAQKAVEQRQAVYGKDVYLRGQIEISNICKNDCLYCGIRKSNPNCSRYRLTKGEILACCAEGHRLGFRTFVLQGGEDGFFTDTVLCDIVTDIRKSYPDCAITLSMGERSRESYLALRQAGADRYLLRHETADAAHYAGLHPAGMDFENRMRCLKDLKELGYQVGCGFMVGSPGQGPEHLAKDLKFIEEFSPDMVGIGPFIPHRDTPFKDQKAGTLEQTLYLLSLLRLIKPNLLLPATTALGTIHPEGRELGILAGANVVMPNLSPENTRKKYELYNNKLCTGGEAAEGKADLEKRLERIGYRVISARGDIRKD